MLCIEEETSSKPLLCRLYVCPDAIEIEIIITHYEPAELCHGIYSADIEFDLYYEGQKITSPLSDYIAEKYKREIAAAIKEADNV